MTTTTVGAIEAPRYAGRSGILSWMLFDWAAQPYYTLITTFIFAPYFSAHIAATQVQGQWIWLLATSIAGIIIALMSPVLGAIADANGRRKPWIVAFGALLVIGSSLMWIGRPGDPSIMVPLLAAYIVATIGVEFATVFNNAMMPTLVPPERIGRLSGSGWATGYIGGIISLVVVLGFLAAMPDGLTLFKRPPALGLNPVAHEGERITGPLTAVWFIVFVLPLFLFTPDRPAKMKIRDAIDHGLSEIKTTLRALPSRPVLLTFLIANMIYADGLISLFAVAGIYGQALFDWGSVQLGIFGVLAAISGMIGAWVGGKLDDRFGSFRVITISLIVLIGALAAILMIGKDSIFMIAVPPPVQGGGLFASTAERVYVAIGFLVGAAAGPLQAASRSLLIKLAPVHQITQYFGLFALTGKVTSFIGPICVAAVTYFFESQRAGVFALVVFFLIGFGLFMRVKQGAGAGA